MTQKPSHKRAKQPRQVAYTPTFKKSWERYNRAGRRDMNAAVLVMEILFSQKIIPKEYLDHELEGHEWQGARELHIGGDFLLVYRLSDKGNLITFVDIGSHSELFG
ncbi:MULTISPECIES: type II toxin-antitoxin system YafQ family toxin [unclassified Providencia]|uniref:type II toxin-antitoxin system YafQ family toxin n=1 Tax=unclassified Providencia TaxID=2633465 RepID=UPI002349C419|nr:MULTISPECIES: type II toxin-antitoxin system YafQ family toxin [unclassified Providencia]